MIDREKALGRADLKRRTKAVMQELRSNPEFLRASEQCVRGLVKLYSGNRILNRILNDRGRVIFGIFALYLDACPDEHGVGLTVTRIASLCQELGVCSRGRAKAIVMLMRWAGYLEAGPEAGSNRRQRPLVPTHRMMDVQILRWRAILSSLALLHPPSKKAVELIEDPVFGKMLIRQMGARFEAGFRLRHYAPEAILFAERDAGILIAWQLLVSGGEGDVFPPEMPVPVPVAALARQFFVSRAHVLKLLREAEQLGMIRRTPSASGSVQLLAPMRETMLNLFAAIFAGFADAVEDALAEYEGRQPSAVPKVDFRSVPPEATPFSF